MNWCGIFFFFFNLSLDVECVVFVVIRLEMVFFEELRQRGVVRLLYSEANKLVLVL